MSLRTLALSCFFLSGATGLLYQVLWARMLGGVIGNTHFSITAVVAVFTGLAVLATGPALSETLISNLFIS